MRCNRVDSNSILHTPKTVNVLILVSDWVKHSHWGQAVSISTWFERPSHWITIERDTYGTDWSLCKSQTAIDESMSHAGSHLYGAYPHDLLNSALVTHSNGNIVSDWFVWKLLVQWWGITRVVLSRHVLGNLCSNRYVCCNGDFIPSKLSGESLSISNFQTLQADRIWVLFCRKGCFKSLKVDRNSWENTYYPSMSRDMISLSSSNCNIGETARGLYHFCSDINKIVKIHICQEELIS